MVFNFIKDFFMLQTIKLIIKHSINFKVIKLLLLLFQFIFIHLMINWFSKQILRCLQQLIIIRWLRT